MDSSNQKVNDFLVGIQSTFPDSFKSIENIRALFFEENDQLSNDIKYGGVVFNAHDKLIGGIFLYKKHLSIEFSNGVNFSDPDNLLEGKGKMRRHLKIRKSEDINTKNVRFYIKQAVT